MTPQDSRRPPANCLSVDKNAAIGSYIYMRQASWNRICFSHGCVQVSLLPRMPDMMVLLLFVTINCFLIATTEWKDIATYIVVCTFTVHILMFCQIYLTLQSRLRRWATHYKVGQADGQHSNTRHYHGAIVQRAG